MMSVRFVACSLVLALGCAAPGTGGPATEEPDAAPQPEGKPEGEPTGPTPDAAATPTAVADAQTPSEPDAAPVTPADAGGPVSVPPDEGTESYTCTRIIGINATAEWYNAGFESMVDNARWELIRVHSGFVDLWANPTSTLWNTGPTSACAGGKSPDRVIYVGLNFQSNKLEQWLPPLTAVVKNVQAKFPGIKRIELATFVRAPGNKGCPQRDASRSTISAAQDEANMMVAAANPALVRVSPKFEAKTCSEFSGNPPHPSQSGGMAWAKMIAEHYNVAK
jgi:hypothetical protein